MHKQVKTNDFKSRRFGDPHDAIIRERVKERVQRELTSCKFT